MKIYISGPMKGKPDLNREAFAQAQISIESTGREAVNPHDLSPKRDEGESDESYYERCMQIDLAALESCDMIFMLPGWKESKGAMREYEHAMELHLAIAMFGI